MNNLTGVIRLLEKELDRLTKELNGIAAAQKARWAKVRSKSKVVPIRRKRTLSAAARRKIAVVQRARWARVKAGKKTA